MDIKSAVARKREKEAASKQEYDKDKLLGIVKRKLMTTGVGCVAAAEKHLGFIWGHKEHRELTEDERFAKEKFEAFRKEALDNTNKQIRNITEEFGLYTITCNGYKLTLPVYREGKRPQ